MNPPDPDLDPRDLARRSTLIGLGSFALAGCGPREGSEAPTAPTATRPVPAPAGADAGSVPERVVTMLGDSITAGYGLAAADALPAQLEARLKAMGVRVRVRAAGVSGDTSAGGLARVDFSVEDDTDLCIVALGGNDMLQGVDPATVRANLQAIIDRLKARHIPVLLAGMRAPPQYGAYAAEFDAVFTELAREDDIVAYPFLLHGVALDRRLNQADGIHPNPAGVKIIAAGLAPVVARALARP
jgi:acyl-CoA thioesterase-1